MISFAICKRYVILTPIQNFGKCHWHLFLPVEEPVCVLLERLGRHEEQEDDEDVHRRRDHQRDQVVAHGGDFAEVA